MSNVPSTAQEAHARVKKLLSERGITFTMIAKDTGVEITALLRASACQTGVTWNTIGYRDMIAEALGVSAKELWPAEYLTTPNRKRRKTEQRQPALDTRRRIREALAERGLSILMMAERYDIPASSLSNAIAGLGRQDHLRLMVADMIMVPEAELWPDLYGRDRIRNDEDEVLRKPTVHTAEERNAIMGMPAEAETFQAIFNRIPPVDEASRK